MQHREAWCDTACSHPTEEGKGLAEATPQQVTLILDAVGAGEESPTDRLLPLLYDELRRLARSRMRRERHQTLQPTALVHEAYLRLAGDQPAQWVNRGHFFAAAAEAMRRVLIDRARQRGRLKRGGEQESVELAEGLLRDEPRDVELLALDEALGRLERRDPTMAQVVKLRAFAGLGVEEVAEALALSPRTVDRAWQAGRAWLRRELEREPGG